MSERRRLKADVCVLGGGAGGLTVAAGAAMFGLKVVLFEPGPMGGECLNTGCVPSKALLAAASRGLDAARAEIARAIAAIAPHDSQERFEDLGVTVIREAARFEDKRRVVSDSVEVRARRVVLATGSAPAIPSIPGLAELEPLTNETVWNIDAVPAELLILGGGPMGCEMAQAFARLGSKVTIVEAEERLLSGFDAEDAGLVADALAAEGVAIRTGFKAAVARREGERVVLEGPDVISGSHVMVAAGRRARTAGLGLEKAGIAADGNAIPVDARGRTTNSRVFAVGDANGRARLTHAAGFQGSVALRNIVFRLPARLDRMPIPAAVYTDPEIAQVGLTHAQAIEKYGEDKVRVAAADFADNDRAQTDGAITGGIKLVAAKRGKLLGVSIVGAQASELIGLATLALQGGVKLSALAGLAPPYPTRGEILKKAAGEWYRPVVFSGATRFVARLLARLP